MKGLRVSTDLSKEEIKEIHDYLEERVVDDHAYGFLIGKYNISEVTIAVLISNKLMHREETTCVLNST